MKKSRVFAALGLSAVLITGSTFSPSADEFTSKDVSCETTAKSIQPLSEKAEGSIGAQKVRAVVDAAEEPAEVRAVVDAAEEPAESETDTKQGSYRKEKTAEEQKTQSADSELGQQIVDYALSWVGVTPYVWAGNSLTTGTDCSGFVHLIYENFGIDVPRSSYDFRSFGSEVSYENAQPGDIICYDGHVALYIGGGAVVHASDETTGTKVTDDAAYRQILTVRRVI